MLAFVKDSYMERSVAVVVSCINLCSHLADHINHQVVTMLSSDMHSLTTVFVLD